VDRKYIAGILCLILLCSGYAAAFSNDGGGEWIYSKELFVKENSGNDITDYPVSVELNDENFDFSQAQADGDDIRFTDLASAVEFEYWTEVYDASAGSAKFRVKIPVLPAHGYTGLVLHFGNDKALPVSDGNAVFLWFDRFDTDTKSRYSSTSLDGRATEQNIAAAFSWNPGTGEMRSNSIPYDHYGLLTSLTTENYAITTTMRTTAASNQQSYFGHSLGYTDRRNGAAAALYPRSYVQELVLMETVNDQDFISSADYPSQIGRSYTIETRKSADHLEFLINGIPVTEMDLTHYTGLSRPGLFCGNYGPVYFDNLIVRKYVDPEPTVQFEPIPPELTINIDGDGKIGSIYTLSGINSISDKTYLFIKGPNLPEYGVRLDDLSVTSISGDENTFIVVPVNSQNHWTYHWDSWALNNGMLFPGNYVIYARNYPLNYDDIIFGEHASNDLSLTLPRQFSWTNWRDNNWMTTVKDQGYSPSCAHFATIGAIEAKYNIQSGAKADIDLSEQDLVYHTSNPANFYQTFSYVKNNGIVDETCLPHNWWIPADLQSNQLCSDWQNRLWKISDVGDIGYTNLELKKLNILYHGPVFATIYTITNSHAVVFAGWNDDLDIGFQKGAFLYKNSWGTGYIQLLGNLLNYRLLPLPSGYGYIFFDDWLSTTPSTELLYSTEVISPEHVNPSAIYCEALSYEYSIESLNYGDTGYCILPMGQKIDAWKFFLAEDAQEYNYCSLKGLTSKTKVLQTLHPLYYTDRTTFCVDKDLIENEAVQMMNLHFDYEEWQYDKNNRPSFNPIPHQTINEGETLVIELSASDSSNDHLTFNSNKLPEGGILSGNKFIWTPNYQQSGNYEIPFWVSDGQLESVQIAFINVTDQGCGTNQFLPLQGLLNPPTDPDGDCIYEDLNGNGRLDFADVVLYFNQMTWIAANEPVCAFDLNGNGRIDFADIVALFNEI